MEKKRMKRRFSEEQISGILKQQESGVETADGEHDGSEESGNQSFIATG